MDLPKLIPAVHDVVDEVQIIGNPHVHSWLSRPEKQIHEALVAIQCCGPGSA
jgi:hypothetical protein